MPDRPVVVVSNRGPLSFTLEDGQLRTKRGGGGLVTALGPAIAGTDGDARHSGPALTRHLGGLRDQGFALADLVEKDDRRLCRHAGVVGAVADVGECAVGESEDDSSMREAVAVEHVRANDHRDAGITLAHFLELEVPGRTGALGREHCTGHAAGEFVRVHQSALTAPLP